MALHQDKSSKQVSKQLRQRASEFLASRRNANVLVDLLNHLESGANQLPCLLTLELIYTELLKRGDFYQEIIPLKPTEDNPETQYKNWLKKVYDEGFNKILFCIENGKSSVQVQALATAMKIVCFEGKYPVEPRGNDYYFPTHKLKMILMKLLSSERNNWSVIDKFQEYTVYPDVVYYTWKLLPPLTPKAHPNELFVSNYLQLLDKLRLPEARAPSHQPHEEVTLCYTDDNKGFSWDAASAKRSLNKAWSCVMHWQHTPPTHKQLLIVLLETVMPHLDKPLQLTDFLMDSLDIGGAVGLLALQGVFTMIQVHNLDYPDIFTKLYSMFEPEIFHTKFKARLFYLSDLFLSSTHLPESLVAAFAKRLARLALVAPHEDVPLICQLIGNLLLRHPGLKCLVNHPAGPLAASADPYVMEERDPLKSNAMLSCLWEIRTLQSHVLPQVATAARFVSDPLPSVEWDLGRILDRTSSDLFDRELRRRAKEIALNFDRPPAARVERLSHYWMLV